MGMENNSPENTSTNQYLTPASSTLPDIEDLNIDNTINDNEAYYEYEVDLRPGKLEVGQKYIVDKVSVPIERRTRWRCYLVSVPDSNSRAIGGKWAALTDLNPCALCVCT